MTTHITMPDWTTKFNEVVDAYERGEITDEAMSLLNQVMIGAFGSWQQHCDDAEGPDLCLRVRITAATGKYRDFTEAQRAEQFVLQEQPVILTLDDVEK